MKKQSSKKLQVKKNKPRIFKKTAPKKIGVQESIVKETKLRFPSFNRSIPVQKLRKLFSIKTAFVVGVFLFFLYVFIILAITSISMDIYKNIKIEQEVYAKRNELYHRKDYWEKVTKVHPGYRDAYYNLAVLEFQLGNIEKVRFYLSKIFAIDPNFEKGRELEKLLPNS